jgi:hypothetical protein
MTSVAAIVICAFLVLLCATPLSSQPSKEKMPPSDQRERKSSPGPSSAKERSKNQTLCDVPTGCGPSLCEPCPSNDTSAK